MREQAEQLAVQLRPLQPEQLQEARALVWQSFCRAEAERAGPEGLAEFRASIHNPVFLELLRLGGAFAAGQLAGVWATRSGGGHLALLFVRPELQGRGVGRAMLRQAMAEAPGGCLTVNAALGAVPFYLGMGFAQTGPQQNENGLRSLPMQWRQADQAP